MDNVDNFVDKNRLDNKNVDEIQNDSQKFYTIRIPADENMLNRIEEYLKFAEITYEVIK